MNVAIVGSREYPRPQDVAERVERLESNTVVVSGAAPGVDSWAALVAGVYDLPEPLVFPAEWRKFGRSAGVRRNQTIVSNCEMMIAFWDGVSKGTADAIMRGFAAHRAMEIHVARPVPQCSHGWLPDIHTLPVPLLKVRGGYVCPGCGGFLLAPPSAHSWRAP